MFRSTLDTPNNRASMPNANFSVWTPLDFVSRTIYQWTTDASSRPATGSLVLLKTTNGNTDLVVVV